MNRKSRSPGKRWTEGGGGKILSPKKKGKTPPNLGRLALGRVAEKSMEGFKGS